MSNHYEWAETTEGYQFRTDHQLDYLVYFTTFALKDPVTGGDVIVYSLGISCKQGNDFYIRRNDRRIKETIITIIKDFFNNYTDDAVMYVCMTDGNARGRRITFGRWFHELNDQTFEKHDCRSESSTEGLYSSLIVRTDNLEKDRFIKAFHHTIDFWMGIQN